MIKIGIIGHGIVGQALHHGFKDYPIRFYDKYQKSDPLEVVVKNSDFIFICLPTPMYSDEQGIDLSIIEDVVKEIVPLTNKTEKIVIIKSTVIPGTTARFVEQYPDTNFCFNPEYLTELHFKEDFIKSERTVIASFDQKIIKKVTDFYLKRFPKTKIIVSDPTTAEMAKYMANCYLAMKVIFAYEMEEYCQTLGVKYSEVKTIVTSDSRIYDSHLDVIGDRGFGGKCFPKDMVALLKLGEQLGVNTELLTTVWKKNKKIRKKFDWNDIKFATSEKQ